MRAFWIVVAIGCGGPSATTPPTAPAAVIPDKPAPGGDPGEGSVVTETSPRSNEPRAVVTASDVDVAGALSAADIDRPIRTHMHELRACYQSALDPTSSLDGKHEIKFTIGSDGAVVDAEVHGFGPHVDRCLAAEIKRIQFPAHDGIATVSYPFNYQAE